MNTFGTRFRITLFGESHGEVVGVVMDGVPAGMELSVSDFHADLERRRPGLRGTTARVETDEPQIISGTYNGYTTGAPLTVVFRNGDARSGDYDRTAQQPRPSHADLAARVKYGGFNDPRGGGRFSGRMTLGIVAAGVLAKKMLGENVLVAGAVREIGGSDNPADFQGIIERALAADDSVGGVVECVVRGVPAGVGEPFFDTIEGVVSHILFAIPGVKGVEFGAGFAAARSMGSANNDPIDDAHGRTATNNDGGVNGGISNGNDVVVRVAVRPAASIGAGQLSYDFSTGRKEPLHITGRHDACIALRMPVVAEAAVAVAMVQFQAVITY